MARHVIHGIVGCLATSVAKVPERWKHSIKLHRCYNKYITIFELGFIFHFQVIRLVALLIGWPTYLPTKFEASGAKRSWVTSRTRWSRLAWPLTLTFDLLTWISMGVIYSSRTIYLPSLKLLGQSVLELSVAQSEVDWHDLWPWPLPLTTYWPEYQ